jgi:hypothetical protein
VYFSIVRDPVDRICSFFNFIHAAPHHPLHETFRQSLTSLDDLTEDFLARHPDLCAAWSNYMAFAWTGVPAGTEDYRRTVRQRVARQIRLGRLVLGEVEGIEALLRRQAVLRPGETLPRRNVRDDGAGDHLMASPDRLRPQVRALLEARNREDIHLLHFLRKRDLLARPEPVARREETSPTPHRPGA